MRLPFNSMRLRWSTAAENRGMPELLRGYGPAAILVLFIAFYTGNNILYFLVGSFAGLVAGWFLLGILMLAGLELDRAAPRRSQAGLPVRVTYRIRNRSRYLPVLALRFLDEASGIERAVPPVRAGGEGFLELELPPGFRKRGVYVLDSAAVRLPLPLPSFVLEASFSLHQELIVWPTPARGVDAPSRHGPSTDPRSVPLSGPLSPHRLGSEYFDLREYRPGDEPRRISWSASARVGHPVVCTFSKPPAAGLWLVLWSQGDPEQTASYAAGVVERALSQGTPVGLRALDDALEVPPGEGHRQRIRLMDALAAYGPSDNGDLGSENAIPHLATADLLVTPSGGRCPGSSPSSWNSTSSRSPKDTSSLTRVADDGP